MDGYVLDRINRYNRHNRKSNRALPKRVGIGVLPAE